MILLGVSCYYHDAAATLLIDNEVAAAAAEERFTRVKHDNSFPTQAIKYCLQWADIKASDIDAVVFYEKPIVKFHRILHQHLEAFPKSAPIFLDTMGSWFTSKMTIPKILKKSFGYEGKVFYIPHHLSHAASAYHISPFDRATIVTLDGVGEWATTTVGIGNKGTIRIDGEIQFPHSLGLFYSAMTAFLGFAVNNDEYKVMGLAAYGNPFRFSKQVDELIRKFDDGSFALTMKYFDYAWANHMFSRHMKTLFGIHPRTPEDSIESCHEDLAASVQKKLEDVVFHLLTQTYTKYASRNLCLAGGVALNSVMNGKICTNTPYTNIYIPPDPGDAGGSMGAALYAQGLLTKKKSKNTTILPYLGPGFTDSQIEDILKRYSLLFSRLERDSLIDRVSKLLIKKFVIGWFQGRMEWGPRALGNRSILASASDKKMKDIINARVKHRELFRPFAPVVLDRYVNKYFHTDSWLSPSTKYMLFVYSFAQKGLRDAPATVHVDGSGRLQVISREDNPLFYDVVDKYRKKTGVPIIINTSFNVRGEPIVCTPTDAIKCFLKTEIDYLVIGSYLVSKVKNRKND